MHLSIYTLDCYRNNNKVYFEETKNLKATYLLKKHDI